MVNPLLSRGLQRIWRGDLEGAQADLTWSLDRLKTSLDPQEGVPARAWLATGATWAGRPEDARAAVADGLASLAEVDQPDLVADLCLAGPPLTDHAGPRAGGPWPGRERRSSAHGTRRGTGPDPAGAGGAGAGAEGRTNRQIAEALFITDKTASVHVSNILAKLGVANRAEAAATVHRLGLTG
jgi:Bacterial regulatory proteins, luxR family